MPKVLSKDYLYPILEQIIELRNNGDTWDKIAEKTGMSRSAIINHYYKWRNGYYKDFPVKYDKKIHYRKEQFTKTDEFYLVLKRIIEYRKVGTSWNIIAEKLGRKVGILKYYYYNWKEGYYKDFFKKYKKRYDKRYNDKINEFYPILKQVIEFRKNEIS